MDGSGHLNDPLDMFDHVIGNIVGLLNRDGLVNGVDLLLDLDNGSIDGLGALQGGGDGDLEIGDGGFQDLGGVSGDVSGLSQVDLFGDDGFLGLSQVGSGKRDGGWSGNGSGVKEGSGVSSMSQRSGKSSMSQGSGVQEGGGWGRNSGGKQGRNNEQGVHFVCFVRPEYFQRCN